MLLLALGLEFTRCNNGWQQHEECGFHRTAREHQEVYENFLCTEELHHDYDLHVNQSYWALTRKSSVVVSIVELKSCGTVQRDFQTAQVLKATCTGLAKLRSQGLLSPQTFVNVHFPSSDKHKLSDQARKLQIQELFKLAGSQGLIMGDLNTKAKMFQDAMDFCGAHQVRRFSSPETKSLL